MLEKRVCNDEEEAGLIDLIQRRNHSNLVEEKPQMQRITVDSKKPATKERLRYTEEDANEIFNLIHEGKYAKSDLVTALKELYGVKETEALEIIKKYDKQKKSKLITSTNKIQIDTSERELIDNDAILVEIVNKNLAKTFGSEFKGNIGAATYGFTRGPTYHLGESVGYIAKVTNPEGIFLRMLNRGGLRMGEGIQQNDFLFVGGFVSEDGASIQVFPQYEKQMINFAELLEEDIKKDIKIRVVTSLRAGGFGNDIYYENNLSRRRENSY
jgi:hypothetical protein